MYLETHRSKHVFVVKHLEHLYACAALEECHLEAQDHFAAAFGGWSDQKLNARCKIVQSRRLFPQLGSESTTHRMSKRPTPGSGLRGIELIKAISTLEELEKLSQEEEMGEAVGEGVEASQGLAAKVISDKIADLIATLKVKAEGPLVGRTGFFPSSNFLISYGSPFPSPA